MKYKLWPAFLGFFMVLVLVFLKSEREVLPTLPDAPRYREVPVRLQFPEAPQPPKRTHVPYRYERRFDK